MYITGVSGARSIIDREEEDEEEDEDEDEEQLTTQMCVSSPLTLSIALSLYTPRTPPPSVLKRP